MADGFGAPELPNGHSMVFSSQRGARLHNGDSPPSDFLNEAEQPELDSDADDPLNPDSFPGVAAASPGAAVAVAPEPYISSQFYTFNSSSHHLMVKCILASRYATPDEIRHATPATVLASWRSVWKDRNEDTAYLTGWKRIQDKLHAQVDSEGNEMLFFKNNPNQYVPHITQWQDIILGFHGDPDLKHLGLKETIDRIKQVYTVGAKFYGIPEPYIKACVASCPVCCSDVSSFHNQARSKRRRFEYTDSFEVLAKDVPQRLQLLAVKHQVVLCIRQKYIRYKPFLAEVKDYCCHRAGEPNVKKPGVLKRKRYSSKRCGCGFRIRAIVPITNYSEKEKTFTYQDDGHAIFKLYAIHTGHEPGPHEGSARIIHRFAGAASLHIDSIPPFDPEEDEESEVVGVKDEDEADNAALQQVHELCVELRALEGKLGNLSQEALRFLMQDLTVMTQRLRNLGEMPKVDGPDIAKHQAVELILHHSEFADWDESQSRSKDANELVVQDDSGFSTQLGSHSAHWESQRIGFPVIRKGGPGDKAVKWVDAVKDLCSPCDGGHSILAGRDPRTCEVDDQQGGTTVVADVALVSMPACNYYQENVKWYDGVSCGLDPSTDCADDFSHSVQAEFRHSIV